MLNFISIVFIEVEVNPTLCKVESINDVYHSNDVDFVTCRPNNFFLLVNYLDGVLKL